MSTSEISKLIELLTKQHEEAKAAWKEEKEALMKALDRQSNSGVCGQAASIPAFTSFDPSAGLWTDYLARFKTFLDANSVPEEKWPKVFLTNQSPEIYKVLANLASQDYSGNSDAASSSTSTTLPKDVNKLTMSEIEAYMQTQYDPSLFIVRERYKYWAEMKRLPGETIQELAARIRQDAATCNFSAIKNPQDEALRTRFICSAKNEAILKAIFKVKDEELTFAKAVSMAQEIEDSDRVAKETVYDSKVKDVHLVKPSKAYMKKSQPNKFNKSMLDKSACYRCGSNDHRADVCRHKETQCNSCHKKGHLQSVCRSKQNGWKNAKGPVKSIRKQIRTVSRKKRSVPELVQPIYINGKLFTFEVDTGAPDNFCSLETWDELGRPELRPAEEYHLANQTAFADVKGCFMATVQMPGSDGLATPSKLDFNVTTVPGLNLLGRADTLHLGIDVTALLTSGGTPTQVGRVNAVFDHLQPDVKLQKACKEVCDKFPDLFKQELGCLKDFELEVKFKDNAEPKFMKPRPVPFAVQEELNAAIDAGIAKGVWVPTQFCRYGTPVVPIRKAMLPGQKKAKLRVCGDYSVTVNPNLETHRQPTDA